MATTWAFFRVPETRGLSYAELDILFANKVNARKFSNVVIHGESLSELGMVFLRCHLDEAAGGDAKITGTAGHIEDVDDKEKGNVEHIQAATPYN